MKKAKQFIITMNLSIILVNYSTAHFVTNKEVFLTDDKEIFLNLDDPNKKKRLVQPYLILIIVVLLMDLLKKTKIFYLKFL